LAAAEAERQSLVQSVSEHKHESERQRLLAAQLEQRLSQVSRSSDSSSAQSVQRLTALSAANLRLEREVSQLQTECRAANDRLQAVSGDCERLTAALQRCEAQLEQANNRIKVRCRGQCCVMFHSL
jgi:hypothetical protein